MSSERQLSVSISYGDVKVDFSGSPDVVMRSLHEFVAKVVPNIDLARGARLDDAIDQADAKCLLG